MEEQNKEQNKDPEVTTIEDMPMHQWLAEVIAPFKKPAFILLRADEHAINIISVSSDMVSMKLTEDAKVFRDENYIG